MHIFVDLYRFMNMNVHVCPYEHLLYDYDMYILYDYELRCEEWRKLVVKSTVVLQRSARLRDR